MLSDEAKLIHIASFRLPRIIAGSFPKGYGKQLRGQWWSLLAKKVLGMQESQSLIPRTQNTKHNQNRIRIDFCLVKSINTFKCK